MLVWWGGRLYYSDALVWLAAGGIAASAPLAWTAGVWPEECLSVAGLQVLDWCLSATVLHCIVGAWLRWSLLPGWAAGRPSLYVLRATSALVGSASLLWLVATLVPRAVLGVSALLSVSLSLSGACWSAALWLQLQECGLAAALPPSLRAALLHTPPLELLGRDAPLAQAVARALQLTGVLLVPEADRGAALQRLPPRFRARLLQRGLHAELPERLSELLRPWESGPGYLRVSPLEEAIPTLGGGDGGAGGDGGGGTGTGGSAGGGSRIGGVGGSAAGSARGGGGEASTAPGAASGAAPGAAPGATGGCASQLPPWSAGEAPEWLLLFVLRQHALRFLGGGAGLRRLRRLGWGAARAVALAAVALLLVRNRRRLRGLLPSGLRQWLLMATAVALARHTLGQQQKDRHR